MSRRLIIGRLHLCVSTRWDNDDYRRSWLLLLIGPTAIGLAGGRPAGNPFVDLYLGLIVLEIYFDRDRSWDD